MSDINPYLKNATPREEKQGRAASRSSVSMALLLFCFVLFHFAEWV